MPITPIEKSRDRRCAAIQLFRPAISCCHIQRSLSTFSTKANCPVHTDLEPFIKCKSRDAGNGLSTIRSLHHESITYEDQPKVDKMTKRLSNVFRLHRHQILDTMKACLPKHIKTRQMVGAVSRIALLSDGSLPLLLGVNDKRNLLSKSFPGRTSSTLQHYKDKGGYETEDETEEAQTNEVNFRNYNLDHTLRFTRYEICSSGSRSVGPDAEDIGVNKKFVVIAPRNKLPKQTKERDRFSAERALMKAVVFHDSRRGSAAFSEDLLIPGSRIRKRRRRMWRFAREENECHITCELHEGVEVPYMMLRYIMVDVTTQATSASFATQVCISNLLHQSPEDKLDSDDDLWLSVADEELSSASSTMSSPRRLQKSFFFHNLNAKTCDRLAATLKLYQLAFILSQSRTGNSANGVTHVTTHLQTMLSFNLAKFRRDAKTACLLHQDKMGKSDRFSFDFSFGRFSGAICCIPIYAEVDVQWFCVLFKYPVSAICAHAGRNSAPSPFQVLRAEPGNDSVDDISLIALLDAG